MTRKRLLLIACSGRKIPIEGLLPAIERYDGVTYRVIRKAQREGRFPQNVDIKILSAKYGLIDASTPTPYYDQRMDKRRAAELHPKVSCDLEWLLNSNEYSEVFINMGKVYLLAFGNLRDILKPKIEIRYAKGGIGTKARILKEWLSTCAT